MRLPPPKKWSKTKAAIEVADRLSKQHRTKYIVFMRNNSVAYMKLGTYIRLGLDKRARRIMITGY